MAKVRRRRVKLGMAGNPLSAVEHRTVCKAIEDAARELSRQAALFELQIPANVIAGEPIRILAKRLGDVLDGLRSSELV